MMHLHLDKHSLRLLFCFGEREKELQINLPLLVIQVHLTLITIFLWHTSTCCVNHGQLIHSATTVRTSHRWQREEKWKITASKGPMLFHLPNVVQATLCTSKWITFKFTLQLQEKLSLTDTLLLLLQWPITQLTVNNNNISTSLRQGGEKTFKFLLPWFTWLIHIHTYFAYGHIKHTLTTEFQLKIISVAINGNTQHGRIEQIIYEASQIQMIISCHPHHGSLMREKIRKNFPQINPFACRIFGALGRMQVVTPVSILN